MSQEHILAFFLFSLIAAITPGPSNVLLTATGAQAGFWRGLPALFGVSAGMGSMMFLAAYGLGQTLLAHPLLLQAARIAGAGFLLWLAWRIAMAGGGTAAMPDNASQTPPRPAGFLAAAMLQWVNPKAWMVSAGAVAAYLPAGEDASLLQAVLPAAGFAAVFVAAALPSGLVWLLFGVGAQRLLYDRRRQRAFNLAMGAALAASVLMILR